MPELDLDRLTAVYIKIRNKKSEIKQAFDDEYAKLNEQQDRISRALLEHCKQTNSNSFRTDHGTVTRTKKIRYWTSDWDSMYKFVIEHEVPEFFNKALNQANVRQFMEDNPNTIPPGLNVDAEYTLSVRKPTKKRQ